MHSKPWRWIVPVLAGLVFLFFSSYPRALAQAPSDDRLDSLRIAVWPEYDQPSVLVQYDGELTTKDKLPRDVSILVPSGAQLNAVAYVDSGGNLLNTDAPKTKDNGDGFTLVTFKLPTAQFHLEFYYNPLQGSPDKKMEFAYKAYQPADNVQLEIQQPLKATNFVTDPASIAKVSDSRGFTVHNFNYATLDAGKVLSVKVSYTKSDPSTSVSQLPTAVPAPVQNTAAATSGNQTQWVAAFLIALALALAALGGVWWMRSRLQPQTVPAVPTVRARPRSKAQAAGFCTQCGRSLAASDNFCPRCGAPRRKA